MSLVRELLRGLLELVYPGTCLVCAASLTETTSVCLPCRSALTADSSPTCPRCGSTIGPYALLAGGCAVCRGTTLHFERVLRLGPYDHLLRDAVLQLKNARGELLAEWFGGLLFEQFEPRLREVGADFVIPVPLHWWRAWRRGYNQSESVARVLARRLGIACKPGWLRRIRATPPQTEQTPAGRWANVRNAFRARRSKKLRGRTVLLVDDVLTTGSTCSEASRALRQAGAARVVVVVLAKSVS